LIINNYLIINHNKYSELTDIYSFGIMLFEILFERFPFDEKKYFYLKKDSNEIIFNKDFFISDVVKNKLKPKLTNDEKLFLKNNEIENKIYNLCDECLNDNPNKRPNFIKIKNILNQINGN
jgi:serine/threonine protein kinase